MTAAGFPWLSTALKVRDGSQRRSTADDYLAALEAIRDAAQAEIARVCSGTADPPAARPVGYVAEEWRTGV